jgi:hypothetical protein
MHESSFFSHDNKTVDIFMDVNKIFMFIITEYKSIVKHKCLAY